MNRNRWCEKQPHARGKKSGDNAKERGNELKKEFGTQGKKGVRKKWHLPGMHLLCTCPTRPRRMERPLSKRRELGKLLTQGTSAQEGRNTVR